MSAVPRSSTLLDCLPFVVDNWTSRDDYQAKPHFLTHCHKVRVRQLQPCAQPHPSASLLYTLQPR